jgi:peptide/nickel transport system permease protein
MMSDLTRAPAVDGPTVPGAAEAITTAQRSQFRMITSRFLRHRLAVIGLGLFALLALFAFVGPLLWPHGHLIDRAIPANQPPSWDHPFGTTRAGHDYLGAVMRGTQQSIKVGLAVAAMSAGLGGAIGAIAGLYGGWIDNIIMRLVDLLFVVPALVIVMVVAGFLGAIQWWHVAFALGAFAWLNTARVVRGVVLSLRQQEFVEAARAMGASDRRIILRHLIPNCVSVLIVDFTLVIAIAILAEAVDRAAIRGGGSNEPDGIHRPSEGYADARCLSCCRGRTPAGVIPLDEGPTLRL